MKSFILLNEVMGWIWNMFIFGGTAYYVFERGESGWWFLLPIALTASRKSNEDKKDV